MLGVLSQLGTQIADMTVDRAIITDKIIPPNFCNQLFSGYNNSFVFHQISQNFKFRMRQTAVFPIHRHRSGWKVDGNTIAG